MVTAETWYPGSAVIVTSALLPCVAENDGVTVPFAPADVVIV